MEQAQEPTREAALICASCDIACPVVAVVEGERVVRIKSHDKPSLRDNICMKGIQAPRSFNHPDRLMHPLRRVGERGSGQWERVSWSTALDDIAERLQRVVDRYGPEALAVATSPWNSSVDNGACRRFMNLLGSPNWISGVALCAGNTAAINRMTYGWFPQPDYGKTECIVLFGHNPKKHSWTPIYNKIIRAQARGAKLIVLDPRRSESAERADLWLPLKAGTDAAMCLGWVKVIIDEGLYDADFVARHTTGFDQLAERVRQYPLERVAEITGVSVQLIQQAARMYATTRPAIIPWSPITDQQINSTSAIRLHCILRAITGNLDVPGGETLQGLHPLIVAETDIELHEALSPAQKAKQLGADTYPVFTYRGMEALAEPTERVWGRRYANLIAGSYMAVPREVFRAMAHGKPYPVKAFFSVANNSLLGYANLRLVEEAMRAQDLVVVHELFKTPTAQLADYILPGDSWFERPQLFDAYGWVSTFSVSHKAVEPPGECKSVYWFWRELAVRIGLAEYFPWPTLEALYNHRVTPLGMDFATFAARHSTHGAPPQYRKYESVGFATPSGKVELYSSVLDDLGLDPLPYYRPTPAADANWPLTLFMGVRDDPFFQTGNRHVPELRALMPEPEIYLHATDAAGASVADGDWVAVATKAGEVMGRARIRGDMPQGLVRVPHGWWLPELGADKAELGLAPLISDGMITSDEDDLVDREQGIPQLRGLPCRIRRCGGPGVALQDLATATA